MKPIRVLLVEDNPIEALQTQKWLEGANGDSFEVEWVDKAATGLDRLARNGIDVVLSDLNLSDSRGLETFIKLHAQAPTVPMIVLTGQDDEMLGALAVESGAQDYLVKKQIDGAKLARASIHVGTTSCARRAGRRRADGETDAGNRIYRSERWRWNDHRGDECRSGAD